MEIRPSRNAVVRATLLEELELQPNSKGVRLSDFGLLCGKAGLAPL